MGGLFFVPVAIVVFLMFSSGERFYSVLTVAITLAFLLVGFIDDFLKIKLKRNEGLTPLQKLLFQIAISLIASYVALKGGLDFIYLPFTKRKVSVGLFSIPLNVLVFIATVNSVNLTDGLDGLCASTSTVVFLATAILIALQINVSPSSYIIKEEYYNLSLFSVSMVGALLGYLLFNFPKASVFMGDSGSLAVGGAISSVCILSGNTLYIPILGICFLASSLSVIIQVIYFKKTKKRVFLMAPIHHHFQERGYSESKICYAYFLITLILSLILILFYC